jgi:spermidine synthase
VRVEKMLGALPLAACPRARDVLVIGLGTGITLGACAASPAPERIVCVEINPAVAAASRYFDRWSGAPLDDPRVRFRRDDGRSYVLATDERFDVITSDPIHPWTKGSSALYTVEHFRRCARLLRPGGVMAQWLPLYQLSPDDYFTVVNSFARAFPRVGLWFSGRDTVLLGKRDAGPWPAAYAPYLIADGDKLRAAAARYHLNTEDRLRLEFTAPRSLYEKTEYPNLGELRALREAGGDNHYLAVNELLSGRRHNLAGDAAAAEAAFGRALRLWPGNEDARQALADIYFERGLTAAAEGNEGAARLWFTRVLQLTPGDDAARANLNRLGG